MNEQTKIGLIAIFSILFLICVKVIITDLPKEMEQRGFIEYKADSIKTHIYLENMRNPRVDVIYNMQDLYNYSNVFEADNLNIKLDTYTSDFFNKNSLIIITIQESSGSISNSVLDVKKINSSTIDVIVNRKVPEVGTMDMAMSHLIIELSKSSLKNVTDILINGK